MDITVKCPNCYQQVSKENRFCIFCGCDLSGASSAPVSSSPAPAAPAPAVVETPAPYSGPRYCPRGHDVPDPSLGFCSICGAPLVDAPAAAEAPAYEPAPAPADEPAASHVKRICKGCGYDCDDPELMFCPSCGIPFGAEAREEPDWTCACGAANPADMGFCCQCGHPKGWRPEERPSPTPTAEPVRIPRGMRPPTDFDLAPKTTYEP